MIWRIQYESKVKKDKGYGIYNSDIEQIRIKIVESNE